MTVNIDRAAAAASMLLAVLVAWESRRFRVTLPADPLGPAALPLLVAASLLLGGLALLLRPGPDLRPPRAQGLRRVGGGVVVLVLYAILMQWLGFAGATTVGVAGLSVLFRATLLRAVATGVVVTTALWLLFSIGLGIPLP